jgi:hypothetical protein
MKYRTAVAAAFLCVITGCGTQTLATTTPTVAAVPTPLGTSLVTAQGTWAIAVMGGSAASENNFWQLFVRPTGGTTWKLVTPPAVADNGGLVAAGSAASLLIGFRPSQDLTFSPLATSTSTGKDWTPGLLNADLANSPDALAVAPGQQLALLSDGKIDSSTGTTWSALPRLSGGNCRAVTVEAVSFWTIDTPVAAVDCAQPGVAGVFRYTGGAWQPAAPLLPAKYARDQVRVLRLSGTSALLEAGSDLLAYWWNGTTWAGPSVLPGGSDVRASGFGPAGSAWVILDDGSAHTLSGQGDAWAGLPALPAGTAVLAPGPAYQALTVSGSKLGVWQLTAGAWIKIQSMTVPIVYGSSS